MKTLIFYLIFSIVFGQFIYGQTYSSLISDIEIYNFLNMLVNDGKDEREPIIKRKHVSPRISKWYSVNLIKSDPKTDFENYINYIFSDKLADSIFTTADKDYLVKQFHSIKDSVWHKPFCWTKFKKDYYKPGRTRLNLFSIPLFSIDKKHVIVYYEFYCGNLCSWGGYLIYKRKSKNKWEYIASAKSYVS